MIYDTVFINPTKEESEKANRIDEIVIVDNEIIKIKGHSTDLTPLIMNRLYEIYDSYCHNNICLTKFTSSIFYEKNSSVYKIDTAFLGFPIVYLMFDSYPSLNKYKELINKYKKVYINYHNSYSSAANIYANGPILINGKINPFLKETSDGYFTLFSTICGRFHSFLALKKYRLVDDQLFPLFHKSIHKKEYIKYKRLVKKLEAPEETRVYKPSIASIRSRYQYRIKRSIIDYEDLFKFYTIEGLRVCMDTSYTVVASKAIIKQSKNKWERKYYSLVIKTLKEKKNV